MRWQITAVVLAGVIVFISLVLFLGSEVVVILGRFGYMDVSGVPVKPDCGVGQHASWVDGERWTCVQGQVGVPRSDVPLLNAWWRAPALVVSALFFVSLFIRWPRRI